MNYFSNAICYLDHIISREGICIDPQKLKLIEKGTQPRISTRKGFVKENIAFYQLKERLIMKPLLVLPKFKNPFKFNCDACGDSTRAIIFQEGHTISYARCHLQLQERILGIYEKELLSIIHELDSWTHYFLDMDHHNVYVLGKQNVFANALSRWPMVKVISIALYS